MHYRVITHPLLGLPVGPSGHWEDHPPQLGKGHTRTDITWIDSHGTILTPPFTVTPVNPVTGHLPLGQTCCWAALDGRAAGSPLHLPAPFWVEGVVPTLLGDAPVAVRSQPPYHVYASHIERVVVRGSGTVTEISWLPASAVDAFEPFRTAPLPTAPGARYAGPPTARTRASNGRTGCAPAVGHA